MFILTLNGRTCRTSKYPEQFEKLHVNTINLSCGGRAQYKALAEIIFDVRQKLSKSSEDSPSSSSDSVGLCSGSSSPFIEKSPVLPPGRHIL